MESNPDSTFHHILTQIQLFSNMNVKWITQIWISNNIRRFYLHIFFIDYCRKINKKIETKVWVHLSINTSIVYLYYKDPKQLKMFLTQNNSRIPLIEVPPSMSRGLLKSVGKWWKPHVKMTAVSSYFFHRNFSYLPIVPAPMFPYMLPIIQLFTIRRIGYLFPFNGNQSIYIEGYYQTCPCVATDGGHLHFWTT